MLTPVHLIFGIRFTSLHKFPEVEDEIGCNRRYGYVNEKLQHCWKRWYREYLTDLRELHLMAVKGPKEADVVIAYENEIKK